MTRISWIALGSALVLCSGCSGGEEPPVQSEPAPDEVDEAPPAEEPPPAEPAAEAPPDDGPRCSADRDCEMMAPCCGCPRVPSAMHTIEADQLRGQCARVRCAACALEPPPGPALVARCVDSVCVERRADEAPTGPRCETDAQCALHTPCCTCPDVPQAMHVDAIEQDNARCALRSCMACDQLYDGPVPRSARCADGACVPVP